MSHLNKNFLIGGLIAIIVIMGVGYAAFATQLNINGTAEITSKWDVHIKDIQLASANGTTGTASNVAEKMTVKEGKLDATFEATLLSPGDSVTYDVTVENKGTLNAKLSGINATQTNIGGDTPASDDVVITEGETYKTADAPANAIVYTITGLTKDSTLEANTGTLTFQVKVEYNNAVTSQPAAAQLKSKLDLALTYTQDK